MIYLPRKVRDFYQEQADLSHMNMGSYLIKLLIENAFRMGLTCSHPISAQVLHEKGKTFEENGKVIRHPDLKRCTFCGSLFEVKK